MKKLRKPQSKIEFYELPVVYILNAVEIESAENQNITIPEEITKTDYKSFRLDFLKDTITDFNPDTENENHTIVTINGFNYRIDMAYNQFKKEINKVLNQND